MCPRGFGQSSLTPAPLGGGEGGEYAFVIEFSKTSNTMVLVL